MALYRHLSKQVLFVYALTFFTVPLGFLIRLIYVRQLSLVDYGLFYSLFAFFIFLNYFRDLGLGDASNYFVNKFIVSRQNGKVKSLFYFNHFLHMAISLVIAIILFLLKPVLISAIFKNEGNISIMFDFFIFWWILLTIYNTNALFFSYFHKQHISAWLDFIYSSLIVTLSLAGFWFLPHYTAAVFAYVFAALFVSIISTAWLMARFRTYFAASAYRKPDLYKDLLSFSFLSLVGGVSGIILSQADIFIIQTFHGAKEVAYYSSGFSVANLLMMFAIPLLLILAPFLARLWHQQKKIEIINLLQTVLIAILLTFLPISIYFVLFSKQLVTLLFGAAFLPSAIIVMIFSISLILKILSLVFYQSLLTFGKPKSTSTITLVTLFITIALDLLVVTRFRYVGIAVVTGISYILMLFLYYRSLLKVIPFRFPFLDYLKIAAASVVFAGLCMLLDGHLTIFSFPVEKLSFMLNGALLFTVAFIAYLFCLFLLGVVTKKRIFFVISLFRKKSTHS